jgi:hypothetical protein
MANYVKTTDFAAKDALVTGNPSKAVTGTALGAEFDAIATMSQSKLDSTLSAALKLIDGTAPAPSLSFINSPSTGLYRGGADILGISTTGVSRLTINASGAIALAGALSTTAGATLSPANANVVLSPTGTGLVTIGPATAGTINNCSVGQTTALAGSFTALSASGVVSGTGFSTYLASPPAIGGTSPGTGSFTTLSATTVSGAGAFSTLSASGAVTGAGFTAFMASPPAIGGTVAAAGTFTGLTATGAITHNTTTNSQSYTTTGAGTITITSATAGNINGMNIGATTAGTGAFTTLSATSTVSGAGITALFASPPAIGGTAAAAGAFTTLTASSTVTLSPANAGVALSPTGTGTVTINPATASTINNCSVGATTRSTGAFTTLAANAAATFTLGATVSGGNFSSRGISDTATATILTLASAGVAASIAGVSGTHSTKIADSATNLFNAGYLELPVNNAGATYTAVLADSAKVLYYNGTGATTYTIPANASVAYPVGTTLTFVNDATGATNMTIAITTDTMVLSPGGTAGSRTLAQFGRATAHKVTATRWIISGSGLT